MEAAVHLSRGCVVFTLLVLLSAPPVEPMQTEPICSEAPRVPTLTRCTRCTMQEIPKEEDSAEDPIPMSTKYCLKWFNRLETTFNEDVLNMTLTHQTDLMSLARLVTSEEMQQPRGGLKDGNVREAQETNQLNDMEGAKDYPVNEVDRNEGNCATQLTERVKKLIPLMSTEAGKRSIPLCDDFKDYTEEESEDENIDNSNTMTAMPKLRVLRDRQISNVSFHSYSLGIDGKTTILARRIMGYNVLEDWFTKSDCPDDPSFGDVDISTTAYPHLNLVGDLTIVKGWSTTQPGIYLQQIRGNISRTLGNADGETVGDGRRRHVASFAADECKVEAILTEVREVDNESEDLDEDQVNDGNIDILMSVEPEINEIDGEEVEDTEEGEIVDTEEGEIVEDKYEPEQAGCKLSVEEFKRLEKSFDVEPNTFVQSVFRQQTISPMYSTIGNRTLLVPSLEHSVEVIEQIANSSSLPVYDHKVTQVSHAGKRWGWERVVEVGGDTSASVWAEIGPTFQDYYNKTFSFYNKKMGPLLVHLHFIDRTNFTMRIERPLSAWQLTVELTVLERQPLFATFKVDELNQFYSFLDPTDPVLGATIEEADDEPGTYTVRWQVLADDDQVTNLKQQGEELIKTLFGRSPGAQENDGLLDLFTNIMTGTTREEDRLGEELMSKELLAMIKLAWKKLVSFSTSKPEDEEPVVVGGRALWDVFSWAGVVAETGEPGNKEGEFIVDFAHYIDLLGWVLEPAEC